MTLEEAINRGHNLAATSIVALAGFAFSPEAFIEDEKIHKLDDALMFVLGLIAIGWYRRGHNRLSRSIVPVIKKWAWRDYPLFTRDAVCGMALR